MNLPKRTLQNISRADEIKVWKRANRGIMSDIARIADTSKQQVGQVLASKYYSSGGTIEGLLADVGAPGMRQRQQEAAARGPDVWTRTEINRLKKQLRKMLAARGRKKAA